MTTHYDCRPRRIVSGPAWRSKAEALKAAAQDGYTHWVGYQGLERIPKRYR